MKKITAKATNVLRNVCHVRLLCQARRCWYLFRCDVTELPDWPAASRSATPHWFRRILLVVAATHKRRSSATASTQP